MSIDIASTHCMQTPSVRARGFMLETPRKAKMNWLQALLAVNEILLKVIPGAIITVIKF